MKTKRALVLDLLEVLVIGLLIGGATMVLWCDFAPAVVAEENVTTSPLEKHLSQESPSDPFSATLYRDALDEEARRAYDVLAEGIAARTSAIKMPSGISQDAAVTALEALRMDDPSLFWLDGGGYTSKSSSGQLTVHPQYSKNADNAVELVKDYRDRALSLSEGSHGDEAVMNTIMNRLAASCHHGSAMEAVSMQTASSALDGTSVCAGYARALVYAARARGIEAVFVDGTAQIPFGGTGNHAWVLAKINGQARYYDPFWYDMDVPFLNAGRWNCATAGDFCPTHRSSLPNLLPSEQKK